MTKMPTGSHGSFLVDVLPDEEITRSQGHHGSRSGGLMDGNHHGILKKPFKLGYGALTPVVLQYSYVCMYIYIYIYIDIDIV